MSNDAVVARWRAERRQAPKSPDVWRCIIFAIFVGAAVVFALHIAFSLLWRRPPEAPIERLLSPAQRTQIEECMEIGRELQVVITKAQENTIRQSGHPYLFEAERARLALEMEKQCRKPRRK